MSFTSRELMVNIPTGYGPTCTGDTFTRTHEEIIGTSGTSWKQSGAAPQADLSALKRQLQEALEQA